MRWTKTLLLAGALCAAGCKGQEVSLGSFCLDGCGGGGWYNGDFTMTTIVGFPRARVDTTGPLTPGGNYYGRLQPGDSVALYLVQHLATASPCTATDTIRNVSWTAVDSSILHSRSDVNGRGTIQAVKPGQSLVLASSPTISATSTMYACGGARELYVGIVRVDSPAP